MSTLTPLISHSRDAETPDAKALWFRSLSLEERMNYLCAIYDMALENNARIAEHKHVESIEGRIRVLRIPPM